MSLKRFSCSEKLYAPRLGCQLANLVGATPFLTALISDQYGQQSVEIARMGRTEEVAPW
jgi:hypothetical protein